MKMNSSDSTSPLSKGLRDLIVRYMNAVNEQDPVQAESLLHAIQERCAREQKEKD